MQLSAKWDHDCFENNTGNTVYEGAHISSVCYRTTSVLDYLENNTGDTAYEEHMLPLFVTEQLVSGPEKEIHEIFISWYYYERSCLLLLLGFIALEPRVFWKQPLYPHGVVNLW